ncbi:MAG: BlaI/MecI/CopY family transcriptional regulator [Defluviitaleaceae bacterium]|nr:BlaI/MecI/CopY family transcriptional regulator [Defluviitaleaceae bacterium]
MMIQRLPDAELAIMQAIWKFGGEVTSAQIMMQLEGKKEWATTTVLNFLARLVDRDFLSVRREGKVNIYKPIIDEESYLAAESMSFLQRLHGNSLTSLVTSLYGGKAISQGDLNELQNFINQKAGEGK